MRTGNFLLQNNNDKMLLQLFYLNPGSLFETDFLSLLQSLLRDKAHFLPSYTFIPSFLSLPYLSFIFHLLKQGL